jgi:hypothetical protein
MSYHKCDFCDKKLENGEYRGHYHCARCNVTIQDGEDTWYWIGEDIICNECKVKDSQENVKYEY